MDKKIPKKVFILQNGKYIEITFNEYCRRAKIDNTYKSMLFLPLHGMLMEVPQMTYEEFYREEERQKYITKLSIENNDFSYDSLTTDEFNGEDIFIDEGVPVCEKAIENILIERLHLAIQMLSDKEKNLIVAHFFNEIPQTVLSQLYGVSQQAMNQKIAKIVKKLRKLIEN